MRDDPGAFQNEVERLNMESARELLPEWSRHIAANLDSMIGAPSVGQLPPPINDHCVVIGAAPSMTDVDLGDLHNFTGDKIVVNKVFKRMVDMELLVDWVVSLDAHPISASQFRWMKDHDRTYWEHGPTKFLISSCTYPTTVRLLQELGCQIYFFNPVWAARENEPYRISQMWGWMNGLGEMPHGGNVGTCALMLARRLMYKKVGVMGIDLCLEPDPKWTQDEARGHEYFYYPESRWSKFVAVPPIFKTFVAYFIDAVRDFPGEVRYLGKSPLLRFSPFIESMDMEYFLEWCKDARS